MNSKKRVLTVINHRKADKVSIANKFTSEIAKGFSNILNIKGKNSFDLEFEL